MVVLINRDKEDQQAQYKVWFILAMVAFKGLMEAQRAFNSTRSIAPLELTYESLPNNWSLNLLPPLSEATLKQTQPKTLFFFARSRSPICAHQPFTNYVCEKLNFSTVFFEKPLDFGSYVIYVKSRFYITKYWYQFMWHYKEYSPSSYMWKNKLIMKN